MFGAFPLATIPLGSAPFAVSAGSEGLLALSDRAFATRPQDIPPNQTYESRVVVPLVIDRQVPLSPTSGARAALGIGEIVVANGDGYFDHIMDSYAIDGRRIQVKVGTADMHYSEFENVYSGTALQWQEVDETQLRISLRDSIWRTSVPLQNNLYAGTGQADGFLEIKTKPKPLCYGVVFNIAPVLVDPARLVYQVHDGPIIGIDAVYSNGNQMLAGGEFVGDIFSSTITVQPGTFKTDISRGLFRLGDAFGQITADVSGDIFAGLTTSRIARRILSMVLSETELDLDTFDLLDLQQPAEVGLYIGSEERPTAAAIIDELMAGISAWWGSNRLGKIQVGRVSGPSEYFTFALDETNIINIERQDIGDPLNPPPYRWRVGYQRNWTVFDPSTLSPAIDQQRQQFLSTEYRVSGAFDQDIAIKHILASDPPLISGLFTTAQDAEGEANRLLQLWGTERPVFRVLTKIPGLLVEVGTSGYIIYPRFGLERGAIVQVVGVRIDADRNEVAVTVLAGFPPPVFTPLVLPPPPSIGRVFAYLGSGGAFAIPTSAGIATSLIAKTKIYASTGGGFSAGLASAVFISRSTSQTLVAPVPSGGAISSGVAFTLKSVTFVPTTLPGLQAWFHPASGKTLVGSKVSQWNDASGRNNHATQTVDANRPLDIPGDLAANAAVGFDGIAQYLNANGIASNPANIGTGNDTPFSICMVMAVDDNTTQGRIFQSRSPTTGATILAIVPALATTAAEVLLWRWDDAAVNVKSSAGPIQAFSTYAIRTIIFSSGTHLKNWVNGEQFGDVACDVGAMSAHSIFSIGAGIVTTPVEFATMRVVEMLVGVADWSTQRSALEAYLSSKYQIAIAGGPAWTMPVAVNDTIDTAGEASIGFPFQIWAFDITSNDTKDSRSTLTVQTVQSPVGGTVSLDTSDPAVVTFTPTQISPCSFQYTAVDSLGNTTSATVTLSGVLTISNTALVENWTGGVEQASCSVVRLGSAEYIDSSGDEALAAVNTQRINYSP